MLRESYRTVVLLVLLVLSLVVAEEKGPADDDESQPMSDNVDDAIDTADQARQYILHVAYI